MIPSSITDAHVHFWHPQHIDYPWLVNVPPLNRPRLPRDFDRAAGAVTVGKRVFVECGRAEGLQQREVAWVAEMAADDPRIAAIVAHAPLENGAAIRDDLEVFAQQPLVRGIRRLLQEEEDAEFCLRSDFVEGVRLLAEFGFSFDICIFHHQLDAVNRLVADCPEVTFILDHCGKRRIRDGLFDAWAAGITELAGQGNTYCKLSGLTTEADPENWTAAHIHPYLRHAADAFGPSRVMFGGDWPVSTLATDYPRWAETVLGALDGFSPTEIEQVFNGTAQDAYKL